MSQRAEAIAGQLEKTAERLHAAAIQLLRQLRKTDEEAMNLSAPRSSALSVVVFRGPLSLAELAAAEHVKPPTMTRLVTALEKQGLVRRKVDKTDLRSVEISATASGMRLLLLGRKRRIGQLVRLLKRADAADQAVLSRAASILEALLASSRGDAL
jgi:DNA-binding MarR family transcriptional regulator